MAIVIPLVMIDRVLVCLAARRYSALIVGVAAVLLGRDDG